jgi:hypothetical protein
MSDSETSSSEIKVKYQNSRGDNLLEDKTNEKKPQTTDTDYYFGMIANPSKITVKSKSATETSELDNMLKTTESESSKKSNRSSNSNQHSTKSSSSSSRKTSESRVKYEPINVIPSIIPPATFKPSINPVPNIQPPLVNNNVVVDDKPKPLTQQEIRMKKIELLRKLCEIKSKGYQLSKEYDFNSSLEEMEYEYELLRSFADKRNGVKVFKNGLLQAVSVIEFLNDKYDPFDFQLSGWGEHMSVEVDSWEDVLEEIYEKYKGSGKKMAPEVKLVFLIIASGSAFHFTKSQANKLPGLDSMLSSNPALLSKIINPGKNESSQFMTPQELNIEKQREELRKKDAENKQKIQQQSYIEQLQSQIKKQNELLSKKSEPTSYGAGFGNISLNEPQPSNSKMSGLPKQIPSNQLRPNIPDIRAPEQVKSILDRLHNIKPSNVRSNNSDTQDESSNNDRIIEESTVSESNKKKPMRKQKKSNISIF